MIKKYSEEKRQGVIEARKAGLTIAQIAAQSGVGRTTLKTWLKDGSSSVCDRTTQKKQKNRNTELKKTGIAPIVL